MFLSHSKVCESVTCLKANDYTVQKGKEIFTMFISKEQYY